MGRDSASWLLALFLIAGTLGRLISPAHVNAARVRVPLCIFDHASMRTSHGRCRPRARHYPASVKTGLQRSIYDGALTFGIPYSVLLSVARCESNLDPRANDGTHMGLFQFLPSTFKYGARLLKRATGITVSNYWNPLDSTYVAGYLFATGQSQQWSC